MINKKKLMIYIGLACLAIPFGYILPITIRNPSFSNVAITSIVGLIIMIGLWLTSKMQNKKTENNEMIPVD